MTLVQKLFEDIEGADSVIELLTQKMPDIKTFHGIRVHDLTLIGSEDLVLGAELVPEEERYRLTNNRYELPHLNVYAERGSIEKVISGNHAEIKHCDNQSARVQISSYTSEGVNSHGPTMLPRSYEYVLDIQYGRK